MDQPIYKNNSPPSSGSPPDSEKTRLNHWAEFLTARKITPTDIDYTVEKSIREGEKEDSAKNDELKRVRQALEDFQQTLPPEKLKELEVERDTEVQRGSPSVQLPSELNTIIYRKDFIPSPPKTTFPGYQFFSAIRTRFFGPTVGQGAKTAVQEVGQKGLQAVGKGLTKGTTALLTKAGLHTAAAAVSAGIGNVIIVVAPKLLKIGSSLIKNTVGWISSGFGLFTALTEGLTGQREVPEDKNLAFLLPVFGCLAAVVFFVPILFTISTGGAFIVPPSASRYTGQFPPEVIHPVCATLPDIFNSAAQTHCVPTALLMAISQMECGRAWNLDCNQVGKFLSDSWQEQATDDEKWSDCCDDTCNRTSLCSGTTVVGPMQFEENTWAGVMPEYTSIDRCRIDLSAEAAARKTKDNSGTSEENCSDWDEDTVRSVAKRYCGSCGTSGCQWSLEKGYTDSCSKSCGTDYCGGVWNLYDQFANQ